RIELFVMSSRGPEKVGAIEHVFLEIFEIEIDCWRDVERDELGDEQAADDDQTQRPAGSAISAETQRDGNRAHDGGERGHNDRAETIHAGIVNRFVGSLAFSHALQGEVDDHDAVLLDDAHQHEHPDVGVEGRFLVEEDQRRQATDQGDGQGGEDGKRMEVAFVQDAEDDVHDEDRQAHEDGEIGDGVAEGEGFTLEISPHGGRDDLVRELVDEIGDDAKGNTGGGVEAEGHASELIQVVDGLGAKRWNPFGDGTEGNGAGAVVGGDVKAVEVFRLVAALILDFQNDLVLVGGALDEIDVILAVGMAEERFDA